MKSSAPIFGGPVSLGAFAAILFVLSVALTMADFLSSSDQIGREIDELSFESRLHALAGPGAKECGFVRLDIEHSASASCLDQALSRHDPLVYAYKTQHFRWWMGLAVNASGKAWLVEFDHEDPDIGTIRISRCSHPRRIGAKFDCDGFNR